MTTRHQITFSNGHSVQVSADPDHPSFAQIVAERIRDEVGANPLRTMMQAGTTITSIVGFARGHIDSQRLKRIEEMLKRL